MPSRTHLKSESILKLTADIQPIEAAPSISAPIAAPRWWARNDVAAKVTVSTPVATT
jgi:hypothetical protein